ncbi:alkaline phosphatase family protein [uncultured Methanobacterium sp.]|uniref:alkaline phosphatase family protein n=1 Tax=uncultured Methanobacterium sp. TaxID=176306 RepID=UPI002AA8A3F4|nr:alkaline phosphatase family protein [uncultured Methanobacterium sp.]
MMKVNTTIYYYDRIDLISHKYGPGSNEFNSEIEYLLENLNKFRLLLKNHGNNLISENVLLILSSDHRHIKDTGNNIYLNLEFPEITNYIKRSEDGKLLTPAGSPRAMFLYIKEEKLDEVLKLLQENLCQKAVVLKTEELLEDTEFSKENSPFRTYSPDKISRELREKLGNLIILPVQNEEGNWTVWWYEKGVYEVENKGHHGGLSRYEMLVPFYAWRLHDWVND